MDKPLSEALRDYAEGCKNKEHRERALDWSLEAYRLECVCDAQARTIFKKESENAELRAGLVRVPVVELADLLSYAPTETPEAAEEQAHG